MAQAVPQIAELNAPFSWRTVDFISDLHLHASEPATFTAWQQYMQNTPAQALFILGDLFEVWVGDDIVDKVADEQAPAFETRCVEVLRQAANRLPVFFMHGNRDFLVGQRLMDLCQATLLADPTVLVFNDESLSFSARRWLLSHGDALCIDDLEYIEFRSQVRSPEWQQAFLARPLTERQAIARGIRDQSEGKKQSGAGYADVDPLTARQWLLAAHARTLIHGHTHKPTTHALGEGHKRVVLSDWDAQAVPPRAQVLRLSSGNLQRIALL